MPELKEVFDMVTKQAEPELDSWKQQEQKQRRTARNRRIGAFALVAAIAAIAAVVAIGAMRSDDRTRTGHVTKIREDATHVVIDLETGNVSTLPASLDGGHAYVVSPDGDELAFAPAPEPLEGDNHIHVYIGNIDGTNVRRATPLASGVDAVNPRWLPDGRIVFQGRNRFGESVGDLYVLDPATGSTTKLTDLTAVPDSAHWFMSESVRPDGQTILFNLPRGANPDQGQSWDLWTIPVTGGEPTLVRRNAAHGSYSPTDSTIAYLDQPTFDLENDSFGATSIWLADADGANPRLLVEGTTTHMRYLRWSPDGTRISYFDESGVYVVDVATGDPTRIADGAAPEWLDDHTLIFERA